MWAKWWLLFGGLALVLLLLVQLLPLDIFYVLPVSAPARPSVFEGLGPAVRFWVGLLAIALVHDYVVSRRDRSVVRPFATVLNPEPRPKDDSVTQLSDGSVLSTSTSGSVNGRIATVTFRDAVGTRAARSVLRADVSCNCPWTLEIRRNSLAARLVARAGAVVATGDRELDAAVVVQADDAKAVRDWLREPAVRNLVLSLFQQYNVESVSRRDAGTVLTAEFVVHNPFKQPEFDATTITNTLCALAETLSQR
jgi:hypothetical protein